MKKALLMVAIAGTLLAAGFGFCEKWPGVDEAVVAKVAAQANRPAREPLIPLEGDSLLFAFLIAGATGGFIAGYGVRHLFPPRRSGE